MERLLQIVPEAAVLARRIITDDDVENSPVVWLAPPFETLALRRQPKNKPGTAFLYICGFSEPDIIDYKSLEEGDAMIRAMLPEAYHDVCHEQLNLPRLHDLTIFAAPVNIDTLQAWCPYQYALYAHAQQHGMRYSILKGRFTVPSNRRTLTRESKQA